MKARYDSYVGILVALLALSSSALAQDRRDQRIANDIVRQVNTYTRFTIFDDVNISVENGLVTLTGKVTMPSRRTTLPSAWPTFTACARSEQIDVLPVSSFDEELGCGSRARSMAIRRSGITPPWPTRQFTSSSSMAR